MKTTDQLEPNIFVTFGGAGDLTWRKLMPALDVWKASPPNDFPDYAGGTWGPDATQGLLVQQGHSWPAPVELAGRSPRR